MTFEVLTARWDQIIRRVTAGIGPGSRVSETLSELFPVMDVERVPGELLILGQTDICMGATPTTGAAAEFGSVQLFNPDDSGKIITVSSVIVSTSTSQRIRGAFFPVGGAGTQQNTERFRDKRRGETDQPTGQIRTRSIGAAVITVFECRVLTGTPFPFADENSFCVLSPGFGFEFQTTVAQTAITVTYLWRERVAVEAELRF